MYNYDFYEEALEDIAKLKKSNPIGYKKVERFLSEIRTDPRSGTGKPERLKGYEGEVWSREINKKDRFVYEIFEEAVLVMVVSSLGHYDDK